MARFRPTWQAASPAGFRKTGNLPIEVGHVDAGGPRWHPMMQSFQASVPKNGSLSSDVAGGEPRWLSEDGKPSNRDRSEDSGGSQLSPTPAKGKGRGKGRGAKKALDATPIFKTRAQKKKQPKRMSNDSVSAGSGEQTDFRHSQWKEESSSESKSAQSACASIIDKYRVDFKGKEPPRIPLCRLEAFTRVRKLQLSSSQAEDLKRSFRINGYMESCHGFHVSPVDEDGNDVLLGQEEDNWDFFWKSASQDFDRECRADPDFAPLAGKKFKVWDGNHQVTVWLDVSREDKFCNSLVHHPRVRCVVVKPPPVSCRDTFHHRNKLQVQAL
ncbi:hypothetical protein R1sor_004946 [Riccia sorocarpa]|uniref:Uncharacterized protein n=1 Tax=Riccia sorocarpa TaxID=122646 RepID=A0ABD3HMH0_9MARC